MRKTYNYSLAALLAVWALPGQGQALAYQPAVPQAPSQVRNSLAALIRPQLASITARPQKVLQDITVSGKVVNRETGEGLPGVTVLQKGSSNGVSTNADGSYTLTVPEGSVLVFSSVGFVSQTLAVTDPELNVGLATDAKALSEIVVVGYGTQNRRDVTGAVSTVKATDLNQTNAVTIDNLIQGKAAGLNVVANTAQPGGAVSINIRGAVSPNGDNSPLYVIDGFPITNNSSTEFNSSTGAFRGGFQRSPLDNLNPNDIESVNILKDASSTAIYGSAAANGVVLITTKRGKSGKATVNYSGTYSIQTAKKYVQPLNATEFRTNVNSYGLEFYKFTNKLAPYGNAPAPAVPYKPFFTDEQVRTAGTGTDYIDFVLRDGRIIDQNVSLSSGTDNTKIFASFNYFDQQALLRNSNFKRYAGRINLDQKIGSRVNFGLGLSYSQVNSDNVATGQSDDIDSPSLLQTALQFAPDVPVTASTGLPSRSYYARTPNPASYFQITNQTFSKRILLTPSLQIGLFDGLKLNLTGGLDNTSTDRQFFVPVAANFSTIPQGNAQRGLTKLNNYSTEGYLTYDKELGSSRVSAVAGVGYYASSFNDFSLFAVGFGTDAFGVDNIGIAFNKGQSGVSSNRSSRTKLSQFTRLNYTLRDRYIVQLTGRFDGASSFPVDNRFGFFPGASVGWVLKQESFLENAAALSDLKLRASYGTSGNESITVNGNYGLSLYDLTGDFSYLFGSQFFNTGFIQGQLGNPTLKWETNATVNVGLDFGFFGNRVSGSVDYFNRTAKDLLDFRVLPSSNAITRQAFNVGSTRSRGVEVTLRTENLTGSDFSWSTLLTLGTVKSFWVERNSAVALPGYIGQNDPIQAIYGWRTDGIIRTAGEVPAYQTGAYVGNLKYVDLNGDGKLDANDVTYLGRRDPKATFGLNNTFKFKGFDLSVYIYGAYGNATNDAYQGFAYYKYLEALTRPGAPGNVDVHALDTYTSTNPNATYPGLAADPLAANNPTNGLANRDFLTNGNDFRLVENSYFARLKDLNVGYSLPPGLLNNQKFVQSVRVFVNFNNLGFVTNVRGFDPETERNNSPYPTALTTAFGLNAQF